MASLIILIIGVVLYVVLRKPSKEQLPVSNKFNDAELVEGHQKRNYSEIGTYQKENFYSS